MEIKKNVCLDAGHSAANRVNKSPDGTYFEHEFALDMAKRIKAHLERHGVEVTETRPDGGDVSLGARCRISNAAKPDLFVSLHSNATGTLCPVVIIMTHTAPPVHMVPSTVRSAMSRIL